MPDKGNRPTIAITSYNNKTYRFFCFFQKNNRGDNSPRLIWILFANPDTSTSYVEVAILRTLLFFDHMDPSEFVIGG